MAGEIQLNSTTMATESSGSITAQLDTIRPNTTNGSLTLQGDSSDAGVTGLTIDSSGNAAFAQTISGGTLGSSVVFPTGAIRNVQLVKTVISADQIPPTGTSVADITGSSISYTPTTGCTSVYYQFTFQIHSIDTGGGILSHGVYIDGVLQDDTKSGTVSNHNPGAGGGNSLVTIATKISAYSGAKTLSVKCNNYSTSYEMTLHGSTYWLNSGNADFYDPILLVYSIM